MADWLFLTNHALVLYQIARHPQITAHEAAEAIGITERAVRKIIADLSADRYVRKAREGRRVRYALNPVLTLRHGNHAEVLIIDYLSTLGLRKK